MSMSLMVKAMTLKVGSPIRKLVLMKLADNANDKGQCWPSYQHIADQCEISKRSVINHIEQLEKDGLLKIQHRKGEKGNRSNLYKLTLGSENPALPLVKTVHHPSENPALPPSENPAPRTSHSLEPVIEPKEKGKTKRFSPPPIQDVIAYCQERGNCIDAERFIDFYQSKNWYVGKNKMKDWKAAIRTWEKRERNNSPSFNSNSTRWADDMSEVF